MNFDREGNLLQMKREYKLEGLVQTITTIYSINGKEISYTEKTEDNEGEVANKQYKYIWTDDFHYKVIDIENQDTFTDYISLNKAFQFIKNVSKSNKIEHVNTVERTYKDNKITAIKIVTNTVENKKIVGGTSVSNQVVKEYDIMNNPTILHKIEDNKLTMLTIKKYKYYDKN
ncbi:hypothetical protein ACFSX9_00330 [Flavobacterium ardleyense]|uniref:Uncharacterized protein n=1 Tax=Flavobacterium ardleyense TaxID=2038737 RepID=A0ABW5Z2X3_9FLAO